MTRLLLSLYLAFDYFSEIESSLYIEDSYPPFEAAFDVRAQCSDNKFLINAGRLASLNDGADGSKASLFYRDDHHCIPHGGASSH